jgi:hypothetical protein
MVWTGFIPSGYKPVSRSCEHFYQHYRLLKFGETLNWARTSWWSLTAPWRRFAFISCRTNVRAWSQFQHLFQTNVSGSHGGEDEAGCFLECCTVHSSSSVVASIRVKTVQAQSFSETQSRIHSRRSQKMIFQREKKIWNRNRFNIILDRWCWWWWQQENLKRSVHSLLPQSFQLCIYLLLYISRKISWACSASQWGKQKIERAKGTQQTYRQSVPFHPRTAVCWPKPVYL